MPPRVRHPGPGPGPDRVEAVLITRKSQSRSEICRLSRGKRAEALAVFEVSWGCFIP